jgi:FAD/FMN-containing dehydrogenase
VRHYHSWGRYPEAAHTRVIPLVWRSDIPALDSLPEPVLPFAYGRSYGDSCLNDGAALLDVTGLDRLISFDDQQGILRCEAGVTLAQVLAVSVPRGWFPSVVPGTRWVSVGGAIANDIHGKNHHRQGTFGAHVVRFELLRSSGERLLCSPTENADLFRATIGGLGLTGVILWAELRLRRVVGTGIRQERIRFGSLDEFFDLAEEDARFEHTVAWVDCLARGKRLGRGLYMRGDHSTWPREEPDPLTEAWLAVPCNAPTGLLNRATLRAFNQAYYYRQARRSSREVIPYMPFFFPLDGIGDWSRLYGKRGFLQYQCVVPDAPGGGAIRTILQRISGSDQPAALTVLKRFGTSVSPGLMSFPRPGLTLAVDFAFRGESTLRLLESLDAVVADSGGAVYPAKDARMSPQSFRRFFPAWTDFAAHIDPRFSSSFWRRVNAA